MQPGVEQAPPTADVVDLLSADHEWLRAELAALCRTWGVVERRDRFERLAAGLARHETAEQEAVYPILKQLDELGSRLRAELVDEERHVDELVAEALRLSLLRPGSRRFKHLLSEIADAVESHAAREERAVFPLLRRTQEQAKLDLMAGWVHNAKQFGPTRPHPHAPRTLAGLLLFGTATAATDRVRDLARRLIER